MVKIRIKLGVTMVFLLIITFSMIGYVPAISGEPLNLAMESTGAHMQDYSINAWVKLPYKQANDSQLQKIVEQVMEQLGIGVEDYQVEEQQRGEHRTVRAESKNQNYHAVAIAQVIPNGQTPGSEPEVYLIVNMESTVKANPSISQMRQKISSIMQKRGSSPRISTCLIGWLDGKLRDGDQRDILQSAFKVVDGKIIDKLELEHLDSYTGFTSGIDDWLQVGGEKVNINIAIRYSQYDNRTYVIIGSPIITREY